MFAGQRDFPQTLNDLVPVIDVCGRDGSHADNRVHGRADIVAHVGEKFTLGFICSLRLLAGLCKLGHLTAGHVHVCKEYKKHSGQDDQAAAHGYNEITAFQTVQCFVKNPVGHDTHQCPVCVRQRRGVNVPLFPVDSSLQIVWSPVQDILLHLINPLVSIFYSGFPAVFSIPFINRVCVNAAGIIFDDERAVFSHNMREDQGFVQSQ